MNPATVVAASVAGFFALVLLAYVLAAGRWRHSLVERLGRLAVRFGDLNDQPVVLDDARRRFRKRPAVEGRLDLLEGAASTASMTVHVAVAERTRWQLALDQLNLGIIVYREDGTALQANRRAQEFLGEHDALTSLSRTVAELSRRACDGEFCEDDVSLAGPPARVFRVRAHPTNDGSRGTGAVIVIDEHAVGSPADGHSSDLAANVSREVRTAVGAVSLLVDTASTEDDPEVRGRLLERVGVEVDRVDAMIDALAELSRLEMSDTVGAERVELNSVLSEVAEQFARPAAAAQVEVRLLSDVSTRTQGGACVRGDRTQLRRAVGNLVDNAIKYSGAHSTITLRATATDAGTEVVVADEGVGIAQECHGRIFERFYRVDASHTRATGGVGLGLAMVRAVVENHRGQVHVSSEEGVGTVFRLLFPPSDRVSTRGARHHYERPNST